MEVMAEMAETVATVAMAATVAEAAAITTAAVMAVMTAVPTWHQHGRGDSQCVAVGGGHLSYLQLFA